MFGTMTDSAEQSSTDTLWSHEVLQTGEATHTHTHTHTGVKFSLVEF